MTDYVSAIARRHKIELVHHVSVAGKMERHVEFVHIDWERRVVWLPGGRWVPFENVAVGEEEAGGRVDAPELAKAAPRDLTIWCHCGKAYASLQALGAHQRFCKGGVAT